MQITMHIITGIMFGLEYSEQEDEDGPFNCVVLDLGVIRFCCMWDSN